MGAVSNVWNLRRSVSVWLLYSRAMADWSRSRLPRLVQLLVVSTKVGEKADLLYNKAAVRQFLFSLCSILDGDAKQNEINYKMTLNTYVFTLFPGLFSRFDFFGIYVVMFLEILKTLLQVIVVFSILIVAFGLSFYILLGSEVIYISLLSIASCRQIYLLITKHKLHARFEEVFPTETSKSLLRLFTCSSSLFPQDNPAHRTPVLSLIRSFIMMLGEIDYIPMFAEPLYDPNPNSMHYGPLTLIFLVVFILLMPILLMNLLVRTNCVALSFSIHFF